MYTPRQAATARWKAFYVNRAKTPEERELGRVVVAALLGHKPTKLRRNIMRGLLAAVRDSVTSPFRTPNPMKSHVPRRFTLKIDALQARRSASPYPKPSPRAWR
jgi:hypothetical protein